ncbi:unnamed protein product [Agarophyton chilense]
MNHAFSSENNVKCKLVENLKRRFPVPNLEEGSWRASIAMVFRPSVSMTASVPFDLLFIQRAPREGDPWSAHIAFPGGRYNVEDTSDLSTALRETKEEVGLDLNSSAYELISRIQDRPIVSNQRKRGVLSTFVFLQKHGNHSMMALDHTEVASAFWVPLSHLHRWSPNVTHCSIQIPEMMTISPIHIAGAVLRKLGIKYHRMPALDVIPHALDMVQAPNIDPPHTVLWGMSLDCLGDVLDSFGIPRVDRPHVHPPFRFVDAVVWQLWELAFHIRSFFRHLRNETAVMYTQR